MATDFKIPALKSLGELKDTKPVIVIDTREQTPLKFVHLESRVETLQTGDYSIAGLSELFAVERKTVSDFVACCVGENRERFERELHRLRGYRFKRIIVIGSELEIQQARYQSRITPKAVFGTLSAFEVRYDCPVVFAASPELAAIQIERWAFYFAREVVSAVNEMRRSVE